MALSFHPARDAAGKQRHQTLGSILKWRSMTPEQLARELKATVEKAISKGVEHSDALTGCPLLNDWQCAMDTAYELLTTPAGGGEAISEVGV